ncbi:retrotransposon protein, putative, ty1-copia subclass, partial [Tanacetum coccineum]
DCIQLRIVELPQSSHFLCSCSSCGSACLLLKSLQLICLVLKRSKEILDSFAHDPLEPEIQRKSGNNLMLYGHAKGLVKNSVCQHSRGLLSDYAVIFHALVNRKKGQSLVCMVLKMKGYIDNLERLGHPVTLGPACGVWISFRLRKELMKGKKHNKPQPSKAARGQNQGNGKNKHAYAPKPKIPPPPKREDPAKDSICHECGETGHWKRNCPQYLAELLKKKKNAAFGAVVVPALVKRDTLTKPDKLEPMSIKCIFIGYPKETMGYSFYYLPKNKVLVARNAEFLENSLINQEASKSLEDLEIIQEEDMHPSIDTGLNHEEDNLEMDEPQSDIIRIRRSTRIRRPTDRMCLYIDAEEHELGDLGEPANYKAALLDPEFDKWLNAMNVEMQSMKDNEVWVLVELPPNGKTVGSKCLFKKKTMGWSFEYIAAFDASKEAVWVRKFISGLGVVPTIEKPINMYCDNTGAIAIANESGITKEKVYTDDNLADPFTKALAFPKHSELTRNIGTVPVVRFHVNLCLLVHLDNLGL